MSQFRLARLWVMLAAIGLTPALMTSAFAQKDDKPAAEQKGPSVRPEVFKLIDSAQIKPLLDAKNFTEVRNRITQAEAITNLTPYEHYAIDRMKLTLGVNSSNDSLSMPALESVINSGFLPAAEKDNFLQALGNMYYNNKNYPKSIEWFKRYQKESPTPEKVRAALIRSEYLNGDYATAKADLLPVIAAAEKAGTAPSQEDLRLLASSAVKTKDDATYLATLEKLVAYYPSDELWTDTIYRGVLRKPGFDAQSNMLDALRLESAAIKKMDPEAYVELAELALQAGFPTEAKKAVDAGYAEGALGTGANATKHRQLRERATKGANDDAKNIASGEASAAKSKNGAGLVNIGWAYVTMDQFDKGIGFIEQGIAKGGLKQPDDARLRLGMAQAKAGHKADAIKTFQGVKSAGGLADIAKYWIILVNAPAQPAAAPVEGK